ncbi:MAG: LysR family transcriptional regulator [Planctomycetota bacterium]|nr:LysR family transcriptional regulator [Planctomycetota bacterium]
MSPTKRKTPRQKKDQAAQRQTDLPKKKKVLHRPPSIEAMRALVAFADADESVTEAARQLGTTQPTTTNKLYLFPVKDSNGTASGRDHDEHSPSRIADSSGRNTNPEDLREYVLECKENRRGLRLTTFGRKMLPMMRELVQLYDGVLKDLSTQRDSKQIIRLATGTFGAEYIVPSALHALRGEPVVVGNDKWAFEDACLVRTGIVRGRERTTGVADGTFDFAVTTHSIDQVREAARKAGFDPSDLVVEQLGGLPMVVAAKRRSNEGRELLKTSKTKAVPLEMLDQWELVGPDPRSGIRRKLESSVPRPDNLLFMAEGGGWAAAREFARLGLGVAILPAASIRKTDASDFVTRPLDENEFSVEQSLIRHRRRKLTEIHKLIIGAITDVVRNLSNASRHA